MFNLFVRLCHIRSLNLILPLLLRLNIAALMSLSTAKTMCKNIIIAILLLFTPTLLADNNTPSNTCVHTIVNDANNDCYTLTPPFSDAVVIDATEGAGEWSSAKIKTLAGSAAVPITGEIKFLHGADAIYLFIHVTDNSNDPTDQVRIFVDPLHDHGSTTDDIEFRIKRNQASLSEHRKITSSGDVAWPPSSSTFMLNTTNPGDWTIEVRLTATELAVNDLPSILGIGIQVESNAGGSLNDSAVWPRSFISGDPANTWANLKTRYPYDFMIVLDKSGSMLDQEKWEHAKKATNFLANTMPLFVEPSYFEDRLGLVGFLWPCSSSSDGSGVDIPLTTVSSSFPGDITAPVSPPISNNCTPIGEGLLTAFNEMNTGLSVEVERQRIALLLSDGKHNRPTDKVPLVADHMQCVSTNNPPGCYDPCPGFDDGTGWGTCPGDVESNINVSTIAFGHDSGVDPDLLTAIKNRYLGQFETTYDISDNQFQIIEKFIDTLDEMYEMDFPTPPVDVGTSFPVAEGNEKLVVVGAWENVTGTSPLALQFQPVSPPGWVDQPCSTHDEESAIGFAVCTVNNPQAGEYRVVSPSPPLPPPATDPDKIYTMVDLNVRARFAIDRSTHGTGQDLVLTAELKEKGQPVLNDDSHPVYVNVVIDRPMEGSGSFLALTKVVKFNTGVICVVEDPSLPDDPGQSGSVPSVGTTDKPSPRLQRLEDLLRKCNRILKRDPTPLNLYDDGTHGDAAPGDGIYTLAFDGTNYEGSYVFRFNVDGTTASGNKFTRSKRFAEYVRLEVDASESESGSRIISQQGNTVEEEFYIIPRDRFGGYLGPGYGYLVQFSATAGQFASGLVDYNNGIYSRTLRYNSSESPKVSAVVQGKTIPVSGKFNEIVPFISYTKFDSALNVKDNLGLGVRYNRRLYNQIFMGAEIGVTPTKDSSGDSGYFLQAFMNARYEPVAWEVESLKPYLGVGVGYVFFRDFQADDEAFATHVSAGASYEFTPNFGLRLDVRAVNIQSVYGVGLTTNAQANIGLVFKF